MAVYTIERFDVRPETGKAAEEAMHALATCVRAELPDATWTMYRDVHAPQRFVAIRDVDRADHRAARQQQREPGHLPAHATRPPVRPCSPRHVVAPDP